MADNFDKLWLQKTSNQVGISRAKQVIEQTGKALPCRVVSVSGSIVTVAFEVNASPLNLPNITIPKAESPWIRMPTQVGDKGMTIPADVYLGGVSGLGSGTASLAPVGNLSALVFVPISNKASPPVDQNAAQVQGPNGAIIQTTEGTTSKIVTDQNGTTVTYGSNTVTINNSEIVLSAGGSSITINASGIAFHGAVTGDSTATFTGNVTGAGISLQTHTHSGVTTGSSNSGPPVP